MIRSLSLQWVMAVVAVCAALPGIVAAVVTARLEEQRLLEENEQRSTGVARLAARVELGIIDGARQWLQTVASAPALKDAGREPDAPRCNAYFDGVRSTLADVSAIGLIEPSGQVVCGDAGLLGLGHVGEQMSARRAFAYRSFAVGISRRAAAGPNELSFAMPLDEPGGAHNLVFATLDWKKLVEQLQLIAYREPLRIRVLSPRGELWLSNRPDADLRDAALDDAVTGRRTGSFEAADAGGRRWLHSLERADSPGGDAVFVAVSVPYDEVMAPARHRLRQQLSWFVAMMGVGLALALWVGQRGVLQPLSELEARLGAGAARPPEPAAAFPRWLAALGHRVEQRDRTHKTLLLRLLRMQGRSLTALLLNRVAFWELDLHTGQARGSGRVAEIFGSARGAAPNTLQSYLALVHSADRARVGEAYHRARDAGLPIDIEHRVVLHDGDVRWLRVVSEPQAAPRPGRLAGAVQDVTERHRAVGVLAEQQAGLAAAVDAARLGTFEEDLRSGAVTWHGHHEAIWGYAPGEFDGSYAMFASRVHPVDLASIQAQQAKVRRNGEAFASEYRLRWPDGSERWVIEHGRVVASESGEPLRVVGVVMDITQRKLAQLRIEQLTQRLVSILESTTDGFVAMDTERRYTYINRRAAEILGRKIDDMLGRSYDDVFPEIQSSEFRHALDRAAALGTPQHVEAEYPGWGRWFSSHIYPSEQGLSVFFRDVTPRKRAERETAELMQRLHALRAMDAALLDARRIDEVAAAGALHAKALLRCWATTFVLIEPDTGRARFVVAEGWRPASFRSGMSCSRRRFGQTMFDSLRRDGVFRLGVVAPVRDESWVLRELRRGGMASLVAVALRIDGELAGALLLISDHEQTMDVEGLTLARGVADRLSIAMQQISMRERIERHAAELERRVAERTAELNAVNRELEAFSYSVSHDLRAPLAAITGFREALLALRGAEAGEQERHFLERIDDSAKQMGALIQAMLDLGHVGRTTMRVARVDVSSIVDGAVARLRERQPARHVEVSVDRGMQATADRVLLAALFDNLLDNAWKFTAKTAQPRVTVAATTDEQGLTVYSVSDNGAGFDMRYADKLFQTFRRLHSNKEFAGTGIGLATVQRIVARHGGRVWAHSEPGVRTVFSFTLGEPARAA